MPKSKNKKIRRSKTPDLDNFKVELTGVSDNSFDPEARSERVEKLVARIIRLGLEQQSKD